MAVPARFVGEPGLQAFDLDPFLAMAERTRKWQDPHSLAATSVDRLQQDTYLSEVVRALAQQPGVTQVELDPEGRWRPAGSTGPFWDVLQGVPEDVWGGAALPRPAHDASGGGARQLAAGSGPGGEAAVRQPEGAGGSGLGVKPEPGLELAQQEQQQQEDTTEEEDDEAEELR